MEKEEEKYIDICKVLAKERVVLMSADFNLGNCMGDLQGIILSTNGHSAEVLLFDVDEDAMWSTGIINNLCCFDDKICWKRGQVIEISAIGAVKDYDMSEEDIESLCEHYEEHRRDDDENYRCFLEQYPNETLYKRTKKQDERLEEARQHYIDTKLKSKQE